MILLAAAPAAAAVAGPAVELAGKYSNLSFMCLSLHFYFDDANE
jgi:hypothetical protein